MDEEQIEEWYATQMQKLKEEYFHELNKSRNKNMDKHRHNYQKKFRHTIDKYIAMQHKLINQKELKKKLHDPIRKVYAFLDSISSVFNEKD